MLDIIWLNLVELSRLDTFSVLLDKVNFNSKIKLQQLYQYNEDDCLLKFKLFKHFFSNHKFTVINSMF